MTFAVHMLRAGLLASLVLAPGLALAQGDLSGQVQRLRDDLNRLQRDYYQSRGGVPPAGGAAVLGGGGDMSGEVANRLAGRMDLIDEQIRSLTGRTEELDFRAAQLQRRLDKLVEDVDFRLSAIEKSLGDKGPATGSAAPATPGAPAAPAQATAAAEPAPANRSSDPTTAVKPEGNLGTLVVSGSGVTGGTQSPTAAQPTPPPRPGTRVVRLPAGNAQEQYNYAFGLLRQGDYGDAEQAFAEFVRLNAADPLAGNAQYWLGETYYVRKDWEKAATTFLNGYQKYPKGNKAPDSLVKLGMTLTNLNQKPEACSAFGQFAKEFPQAPVALKQLAQTERGRAGCK